MRAYIQTRGSTADYAFLGAAPDSRWWLEFRDTTSFEKPTVIVRGQRGEWRCYLSGIPSRRTDRVGTAIRYTVILEGRCDEHADNALQLVATWLSDATNGGPSRSMQDAMDSVFDEAMVERLLAVRGADSEQASEVQRLTKMAMEQLPPLTQPQSSTEIGSWAGSATSVIAQSELLALIAELLRGKRDGTAALLNLLDRADEVTKLAEQVGPIGALIEDPACALGDAVVPVGKKNPSAAASPSPSRRPQTTLGIAILIGAIVFLMWILVRTRR